MDKIDKLALEQLHLDIAAFTAAVKELTEAIKNKDDIGADREAMPVKLVAIGEDALAILAATPLTVTDGGTPLQVEVTDGNDS